MELNPITISIYSGELKECSRDCRCNGVNSGERSDHSYSAIFGFSFYLVRVPSRFFFVTISSVRETVEAMVCNSGERSDHSYSAIIGFYFLGSIHGVKAKSEIGTIRWSLRSRAYKNYKKNLKNKIVSICIECPAV